MEEKGGMNIYKYSVIFKEQIPSGNGFLGSLEWNIPLNRGDYVSFEDVGPHLVTANKAVPEWAKGRSWEVIRVEHSLDGEYQGTALTLHLIG